MSGTSTADARSGQAAVLAGAGTALAALLLFGGNLDGYPLLDPDESKHAEAAREMLADGRWVEPLINYEPYHHKPSPFYVLVGLAYRALGVHETAARIVPAACAGLTLIAVAAFSARRSVAEGLLAALLLAACGFFVFAGRFTSFDAPLTLAMTAAVLSLARLVEDPRRAAAALAFHVSVAVAVLIKGPVALVLAGVPLALVLLRNELEPEHLRWRVGIPVAGAIVAAWLVPALVSAPEYVANFLWVHNVQRFLAGEDALVFHPQPVWFFLPVLAGTLLPWSPLLPAALARAFEQRGAERLLAEYALWVVLFFSMSSGKLATYVLPAYPALAVLAARLLADDADDGPRLHAAATRVAALVCAVLAMAAFVLLRLEAPGLERMAALFAPVSLAGGVVLAGAGRVMTARAATVTLCGGMLATIALLVTIGAPAIGPYASDRDLAQAALAHGRPQRVIAYRVRPFSFLFYTGWPVQNRVPLDEVQRALFSPGSALVLTEDRWAWHLEDAVPGVTLVELARNPRHVLYRVVSPWSGGWEAPESRSRASTLRRARGLGCASALNGTARRAAPKRRQAAVVFRGPVATMAP